MTRPPFKWVGGKSKLAPEIADHAPAYEPGRTYHEPFCGGAAVYFHLASMERQPFDVAFLNDVNWHVYNCLLALKQDAADVADHLATYEDTAEQFEAFKREPLDVLKANPRHAAVRFLYLNRTGFNGLWRENKAGEYNVPRDHGSEGKRDIVQREKLIAAGKALKPAVLSCMGFEEFLALYPPKAGSFVYVDPPYAPKSETENFTTFSAGGFGLREQRRLEGVCRGLARRGVQVVASNSDVHFTRYVWGREGWELGEVKAARAINRDGTKRGKVSELLMTWPRCALQSMGGVR